jgi:hypothetical protein
MTARLPSSSGSGRRILARARFQTTWRRSRMGWTPGAARAGNQGQAWRMPARVQRVRS